MGEKVKDFVRKNYIAIIIHIIVASIQLFVYNGSKYINGTMYQYNLNIDFIDNLIPFVNWFIIIYVLCYPWWYLGPFLSLKYNRRRYYNYLASATIGYIIAGIFFIVLPTTIARPVVDNNNIFNILVNLIYEADTPATNLFPSLHCFISWNCYLSIRKEKTISMFFRISYLIFACLVCASTVLVKQHFFVDIIGGVLLAEITWLISDKFNLGDKLLKIENKYVRMYK